MAGAAGLTLGVGAEEHRCRTGVPGKAQRQGRCWPARDASASAPLAALREGALVRVLVVSDHPVVRLGLAAMVGQADDVEVVGEAGLGDLAGQVAALRPEVAVIDLGDVEPDDLEVLWRLTAELPQTAVVVLSHNPTEARARLALQAGAKAYLLWDASPEEMSAAVQAVRHGLTVIHSAVAQPLLDRSPSAAPQLAGEPLTARERDVLQLLAQGLPSKTIATRLGISEHTVKFHVGSILAKLGAASRTEAVAAAIRRGLITL